ncbi:SAM-dependent methyltransferase [Mesorhizobium sp. Root552]|uniref:class I SAM-dependent methyltransferase n=1 Tax=Mesorhizobium sp. Root552 TaxID=1736555 RepID=UPI0006FCC517|nr:class I SAM-dependent methyltransferase [Mesorhizobium sp. Root552]KQZ16613.1 SAM-dependent methyltransferase [Mesorhizobium sp. Root552]
MEDILEGYAAAATPALIGRYESFDFESLYAPVLDLMPKSPARVADIGSGTGRDAAWLADRGHRVLAVEPVQQLREAGIKLHPSANITWLDDRLPELEKLEARGPFDMVLLCGVWQHLDEQARRTAMIALGRLVAANGILIMSLRHGPGAPGRRVFPISPQSTVATAGHSGFSVVRQLEADSIQPENRAADVYWTWLAFTKGQ